MYKEILNPYFKHSTTGEAVNYETKVELLADEETLTIHFQCEDNPFTSQNYMKEHNAPLYNQEVFEVFISNGIEVPTRYWEIEINPHAAIWIGEIEKTGNAPQQIIRNLLPEEFGLEWEAKAEMDRWEGKLVIPWASIGAKWDDDFRLNFYRIRSKVSHEDPNWTCDAETCDFICWQSTLSGDQPAFHRPEKFGKLKIK
jgi:hypothetical protein